jgi:MFS transporter, FSR family, fosmidomycin resistance protein
MTWPRERTPSPARDARTLWSWLRVTSECSTLAARLPSPLGLCLSGGAIAALLALAHTANDALSTVLAALLPSLQERHDLSASRIALLVSLLWISLSLGQPLFGALSERVSGRLLAALGIALTSLLALVGVAPNTYALFALVLVAGLGTAILHPVGTNLARSHGGAGGTFAVSLFGAGGMFGAALGPIVILAIVPAFGLAAAAWLALPVLAFAALVYLFLPPDEPLPADERSKLFERSLVLGPVGLLTLAGAASSLAFIAFTSAMPILLADGGLGVDSWLIGWAIAIFALGAGIGALVAGALAGRVDRTTVVAGSFALAPAPLVAALFLEPGGIPFFAAAALAGALTNAGWPPLIVAAQDFVPQHAAAAAGVVMGFSSGVGALLYVGVGELQERVGLELATSATYLLLLPAAALAALVLARRGTVVAPAGRRAYAAAETPT